MAIGTVEFDLSMANPETGRRLVAHVYTVDGITNTDGSLRELSIGQLVMALCLTRASELEARIIGLMESMNTTSAQLEAMTEVEQAVVDWADAQTTSSYYRLSNHNITSGPYAGVNFYDFLTKSQYGLGIDLGVRNYGDVRINDSAPHDEYEILYDAFIEKLESKMDEKNSFSQQTMIELQSQTSKRDQAYDMISNILKSLNTVLVGNANNM